MTTYNEIAGRRVNFLSSDPSYVDTNSDGQVWYNSTSATLKAWLPTGVFSAGGNLNTARYVQGAAGAGTQSNTLTFGGFTGPGGANTAATEAYNGIAWTNGGNLGTARRALGGAGASSSSAVAMGGFTTVSVDSTELYNGTSWTNDSASLATGRVVLGGSPAGTQTSALAFAGTTGSNSAATEEYTGAFLSTKKITTS